MPERDEYARCKDCGGAQGYGSAMQGKGLCYCPPKTPRATAAELTGQVSLVFAQFVNTRMSHECKSLRGAIYEAGYYNSIGAEAWVARTPYKS